MTPAHTPHHNDKKKEDSHSDMDIGIMGKDTICGPSYDTPLCKAYVST